MTAHRINPQLGPQGTTLNTYEAHRHPQCTPHSDHTGTPHTPVSTRPRVAPMPSSRSTTSLAHGRLSASMCTHSRSSAARGGRPRCNTPPSPASLSAASISCPLRGYVSGGLATPPSACTGAIQENTAVHPCASCHATDTPEAGTSQETCVLFIWGRGSLGLPPIQKQR
jgi:hypothetical protein